MIPTMLPGIAKAAWLILTVIVLLISLFRFDGKPNSDIGIFFAWMMLVLAFPISLLVALSFAGISIAAEAFLSKSIPTSYWSLSIAWICFFVAGYWQWFVLLPWSWQKWKTWRGMGTAASL